ncbi:hypothetical protein N431DRAFT_431000 [Stipitochalara longipes BDJ]|nr:hypothetical protein N431DRAFT_431000 [Stipitochalara longipes BDJ]
MRLLNIKTMKMEEFLGETVPPYVILSHRWGSEEVSLQERERLGEIEVKLHTITTHRAFEAPRHENDYYHESLRDQYSELEEEKATIKQKTGYSKIISCAELARSQKISSRSRDYTCSHVWIDTCCIDKTNNSELSEAINSMFRWYKCALICLVYLSDVSAVHSYLEEEEMERQVRVSNWFERGWTLQELLAPSDVYFYDQRWKFLFDRDQQSRLIAQITRIDEGILKGYGELSRTCTARKMSWASTRTTTRKEDLAYCLIGIFDINMPLLYGEGDKAFLRLQEEIIKQSGDASIFAWGYHSGAHSERSGMFAHSPADFIGCSDLKAIPNRSAVIAVTNITLEAGFNYYTTNTNPTNFIYVDLNCLVNGKRDMGLFLPLVKTGDEHTPSTVVHNIASAIFQRPAGVRPILISDVRMQLDAYNHQIRASGKLSIEKIGPLRDSYVAVNDGDIALLGLSISSTLVVDEVYPPTFWGKKGYTLNFGNIVEKSTGNTGPIMVYIKISHRRHKGGQIVIILRFPEPFNTRYPFDNVEVNLAKWSSFNAVSLVDRGLNNDLSGREIGDNLSLIYGVAGDLGEFSVRYGTSKIIILVSEDAAGSFENNDA